MRARLFVVFLVPLTCVMLVLSGAYAWSVSRSVQQEFTNQQLTDLSYFVVSSRHALRTSNPGLVESEMARYAELYNSEIAVLDRTGAVWASGGMSTATLDEETAAQVTLALSGRRSEMVQAVLPWSAGEAIVVEPIFDDGSVIGAVMISASAEGPRGEVLSQWTVLIIVVLVVVALLVFAVFRLASWVLQPMRRVDQAMLSIEQGDMDARIDDDTGPPEMRRMIRVFNGMAEEIERVVSRQQEFVLNASHELRNPLGALTVRIESLVTGLDDSWGEDVEQTREEVRRMTRILDTLLVMAKSGQKDSSFALVDLAQLASSRASAWFETAAQSGVTFRVLGPTSVMSITDRTTVESALDAVLDNAVKFAPAGSTIDVTVRFDGGCSITVRDHGPGLDPDDLARATERFWRNPRDQNVPGSGLGLAIATDLLTSLGGAVHVVAADGGGLAVSLHLPGGEL